MKGIECVVTLLGGAVLGAAAALLFAPCSGKEMRERMCGMMRCGCKCHDCNCHHDEEGRPVPAEK